MEGSPNFLVFVLSILSALILFIVGGGSGIKFIEEFVQSLFELLLAKKKFNVPLKYHFTHWTHYEGIKILFRGLKQLFLIFLLLLIMLKLFLPSNYFFLGLCCLSFVAGFHIGIIFQIIHLVFNLEKPINLKLEKVKTRTQWLSDFNSRYTKAFVDYIKKDFLYAKELQMFEDTIKDHERNLSGIKLYYQACMINRNKFSSYFLKLNYNQILRRNQKKIIKAKDLLNNVIRENKSLYDLRVFSFPKIKGHPVLDDLYNRSMILMDVYDERFLEKKISLDNLSEIDKALILKISSVSSGNTIFRF